LAIVGLLLLVAAAAPTDQLSGWAGSGLILLGAGAAIFWLPMVSYVQWFGEPEARGATHSVIQAGWGIIVPLAAGLLALLVGESDRITVRQAFLIISLLAVPIFLYAVWRVPQAMARLPLWWAFRCLYRVRINGVENIPPNGGAVLVINHSTWIDGLIILLMSARRIRMIAWAGNFNSWIMRVLGGFAQVILITGGPKSIQRGLSEGRKALTRGELVGIFPEGGITRTAQVRGFRPGLMKMLDQLPVPIIPVYIDQVWGSIFSYSGGTSLRKFPRTFRHRVTINIGRPMTKPDDMHFVRQAVMEEGARAVNQRQPPFVSPAQMFIRACRKRRFRAKIGDSTGHDLTGGMLLVRCLILRHLLRRHTLADDERIVGVLIPPSTGGVLANMGLALDRRVAVHLNYTLSERLINECIRIAGIKTVLTTRRVLEKFNFNLQAKLIFVEDLKGKVSSSLKASAMLDAFVCPKSLLEARLGLRRADPDELLTVIFTSGSTGIPKGVMLSHRNIASNVEAIGQVICLNPKDTLIGVLPFFHSFGYTVTLWGAMGLDVRGAYHFSPLEAAQIGKLTRKYQGTVLLGTPTFLRTYLRKCTREDFASVNTVVAGAEKLPAELAVAFDHRFGVRPVEGYGTTELSPLVSVNVPPSRSSKNFQPDSKDGSVGRPIPNTVAKITDLDDPNRELGANQTGMLWIKGPNVMLGYMNRPEATAEVVRDGWYCTGDVGVIDVEGFITLTGRMSRFSKIGGEMVPHIQIEESLCALVNEPDSEVQLVAVTAVPDPKKGERLVVLHTKLNRTPSELCQRLRESGLPNLYIPGEDSFFQVDAIPVLGSGKLDLKRLKEVALQLTGQANAPQEPAAAAGSTERHRPVSQQD
jgi:acyl-[acyl-carrier-protein]-phospholipid O-acyltransferase/long-chain-fatty-acid--[acyl-carrier-protein] ligase